MNKIYVEDLVDPKIKLIAIGIKVSFVVIWLHTLSAEFSN